MTERLTQTMTKGQTQIMTNDRKADTKNDKKSGTSNETRRLPVHRCRRRSRQLQQRRERRLRGPRRTLLLRLGGLRPDVARRAAQPLSPEEDGSSARLAVHAQQVSPQEGAAGVPGAPPEGVRALPRQGRRGTLL